MSAVIVQSEGTSQTVPFTKNVLRSSLSRRMWCNCREGLKPHWSHPRECLKNARKLTLDHMLDLENLCFFPWFFECSQLTNSERSTTLNGKYWNRACYWNVVGIVCCRILCLGLFGRSYLWNNPSYVERGVIDRSDLHSSRFRSAESTWTKGKRWGPGVPNGSRPKSPSDLVTVRQWMCWS